MTELSRSAPCWSRPSQSVFARLDRAGQPHTSVYVRYASNHDRSAGGPFTKYRRVSRLSASTICGCITRVHAPTPRHVRSAP